MTKDGGNGKSKLHLHQVETCDGKERCSTCEWAAMTHANHVRLGRLERREGEWIAELRATRDSLFETRQMMGGEFASLSRNVVDAIGGMRADLKAVIVRFEQLSRAVLKGS